MFLQFPTALKLLPHRSYDFTYHFTVHIEDKNLVKVVTIDSICVDFSFEQRERRVHGRVQPERHPRRTETQTLAHSLRPTGTNSLLKSRTHRGNSTPVSRGIHWVIVASNKFTNHFRGRVVWTGPYIRRAERIKRIECVRTETVAFHVLFVHYFQQCLPFRMRTNCTTCSQRRWRKKPPNIRASCHCLMRIKSR